MTVSSAALRRAAVLVLVALAVATTCTLLGRWQWNKHVARDAVLATQNANWTAPPVALTSLVAAPATEPVAADEWRSVRLTGHYLAHSAVLLRNRPVNGQPAYHVLVPFQADGGDVLVVDRGWVPVGNDAQRGEDVPAPPAGTIDLVARLRLPEPDSNRSAPPGQVQNFAPTQVLAAGHVPTGTPAYRWYASMVSEQPGAATPLDVLETPSTDPGPYLSYAIQWWVFALGALAAFGWMARREILDDLAGRAPAASTAAGSGRATLATGPPDAQTAARAAAEPGAALPPAAPAAPAAPTSGSPTTPADLIPAGAAAGPGAAASATPDAGASGTETLRTATPGAVRPRPATRPAPLPARRPRGRDELAEDALIDAQHPGPPA